MTIILCLIFDIGNIILCMFCIVRSSESIFGYLWQIFIFSTNPGGVTIIGVVCMMVGVSMVAGEKIWKVTKEARK